MKKIKVKNLTKQIICIIIVLMLCNFIMPNYIYAVDTGDGGSLMEVIAQFICFIPDAVMNILQEMFVSPDNIKLEDGGYSIRYSPGVIFSGQVPALDIDFITPSEGKVAGTGYVSVIEALESNGARQEYSKQYAGIGSLGAKDDAIEDIKKNTKYEYDSNNEINISELEGRLESLEEDTPEMTLGGMAWDSEEMTIEKAWYNDDKTKIYIIVDYYNLDTKIEGGIDSFQNTGIIYLYEIDNIEALNNATKITGTYTGTSENAKEYESSAGVLQSVAATWYKALRRIALVGLLSAIVYIGIKIVLSSTSAKDKAKYKSMLKDWVIAICLLFTLHYIMSITITVVDNINEVIKASTIGTSGEDILMTSVRNKILNGESWSTVLTYVVIYFVLVIYTIIYTIQYLRRVIYIGFLTMIAPLITLTYPLDKIKDSKAQAFDMWLKDYIFFSLIQVVHLLIYYVFVSSSIDLTAEGNWLFALVAIGFITPAEKLIKKMFGFEKAKTLGAMGAGATGALIMNAIQKIPQGGGGSKGGASGKKSDSESTTTKAVRTAGANPFVNFSDETTANSPTRTSSPANGSPNAGGGAEEPNEEKDNTKKTDTQNVGNNNKTSKEGKEDNEESKLVQLLRCKKLLDNHAQTSFTLKLKRQVKGAKAVAGKYFAPVAGGTIRFIAKSTGVVFGVSAAIAKGGDLSEIGTGIAVGAATGDGVVNVVENGVRKVSEIPEKVDEVVDTWREGAYGKEVAQNAKFDRVFRSSKEYKDLRESTGFSEREFDKRIQKMLDEGIKDPKQMKKILKNHKLDPKRYSMDNAIKYSKLAEKCSEDILYDKVKFIRFCKDRKLGLSEEELVELRKDMMKFK